jgi:hypothetical protein
VETAALVEAVEKLNYGFPTAPTALGKLANSTRVFHSSHSPDYGINKKREEQKLLNLSLQLLLHFQLESANDQ